MYFLYGTYSVNVIMQVRYTVTYCMYLLQKDILKRFLVGKILRGSLNKRGKTISGQTVKESPLGGNSSARQDSYLPFFQPARSEEGGSILKNI